MSDLAHWYSLDDQAGDGTATALCGYQWVPDPSKHFDNICPPCMSLFIKERHGMNVMECRVNEGDEEYGED